MSSPKISCLSHCSQEFTDPCASESGDKESNYLLQLSDWSGGNHHLTYISCDASTCDLTNAKVLATEVVWG